jgi:hypothetical protein
MLTLTFTSMLGIPARANPHGHRQPRRAGIEVRDLEQAFGFTGTSEPISFTFIGRTRFVFTWSPIVVFLVAENAVAVLARLRLRPALVRHGMPYHHAQGRSVSPNRIGARNSWVR